MNKSSNVADCRQEARAGRRGHEILDGGFLDSVGERLESNVVNCVPLGEVMTSVYGGTRA